MRLADVRVNILNTLMKDFAKIAVKAVLMNILIITFATIAVGNVPTKAVMLWDGVPDAAGFASI